MSRKATLTRNRVIDLVLLVIRKKGNFFYYKELKNLNIVSAPCDASLDIVTINLCDFNMRF